MRQKINASNLIRIYNRNGTVKRSNLRPGRRNLTERKTKFEPNYHYKISSGKFIKFNR
ncbi:hypothetical protein CAMRE0001_0731 [Campylobacter rectus RM3267]|uniref:Uncharacterized protein n=1 Tax=Campylobacter rectus RM3267 TaxID=553218 RepID=B9CZP1_CAMRE|nr:hypothetical protein [Campylobacter rectus]EEF14766.1 hypothetical protein CAMRE0001_0731 [Campylobacter rectus RM3267]UEB46748.1 hypothetical protein LK437_06890 [Campylobacter rectus]